MIEAMQNKLNLVQENSFNIQITTYQDLIFVDPLFLQHSTYVESQLNFNVL